MPEFNIIYTKLLEYYGKQNWWPISYNFQPKEWEICIGAILTQNTNWNNVEKALSTLNQHTCITPDDVIKIKEEKLYNLIRSSGFYKKKTDRLKNLSKFISTFKTFEDFKKKVKREDLLGINGIGPETADSILLYACDRPYFVIDTYTKRLCNQLNIKIKEKPKYEDYRELFEENLPKDVKLYKEFHALIVRCGKDKFKALNSI